MKYKIPSWSSLRTLGESKVIKLTFLTPVFGYVIIFSDYFIQLLTQVNTYLSLSQAKEVAISNAYFMYFGLLLLGIASGIYALFSPNLCNEYKSIRSYLNENIDNVTLSKLVGLADHVNEKYTLKGEAKHTVLVSVSEFEQGMNGDIPLDVKEIRTLSIDLFSHFWNQTTYSRTVFRTFVSIFYVIGFGLLLMPTIKLLCNIVF
tara:strand:- start:110 stop:721 length:612 start_codon:yes stop_codon:yes gene_type:complete